MGSQNITRMNDTPVALGNYGEIRLNQKRVREGVMLSFGHFCFSRLNCNDVEENDAQYPHPCHI